MRSGIPFSLVVSIVFCASAFGYDWSTNPGDGSPEHPYEISTPEHLMSIGSDSNLLDNHFVLIDDIILPEPQTTGPNTFNCPVIGDSDNPFTGTFNGQSHSIAGLYWEEYKGGTYVGLFGVVKSTGNNSGIISNLSLIAPVIVASHRQNAGALVGNQINGEISQCAVLKKMENGASKGCVIGLGYMNMAVGGELGVGGLVGLNSGGHIEQCYSDITVQLNEPSYTLNYVGGLIGKNDSGIIESCYSKATVGKTGGFGEGIVGGLVGYNNYGFVIKSYTAVSEGFNDNAVGAFVGKDYNGSYFLCYANPSGLENYTSMGVEIKSPAEMMSLDTFRGWGASAWVLDQGTDTPHLAWEGVVGTPIANTLPEYGGGSGTIEDPYQIRNVNHLEAIGYYREEFDKHFVLMEDIHFDAPVTNSKNFQPIGVRCVPFTGTFNGNYKTISGLYLENGSVACSGLFGAVLGEEAVVKDLTLNNVQISSIANNIGGLAGYVEKTTLQNCHVNTNLITGDEGVGGLVGWIYSGTIDRCSVSGAVEGTTMVGGLAGRSGPGGCRTNISNGIITSWAVWVGQDPGDDIVRISQCQSQATVLAEDVLGGFIGIHSWGVIENSWCKTVFTVQPLILGGFIGVNLAGHVQESYSASSMAFQFNNNLFGHTGGFVGFDRVNPVYASCYYKELDYHYNNGIGTALTEAQMKARASFLGFDFVGESANGDNDIWRMCVDEVDYPRLSWEFARNGDFACGDGVDFGDLLALAEHWLTADTAADFNYACDANGDEVINLQDFSVLSENWQ